MSFVNVYIPDDLWISESSIYPKNKQLCIVINKNCFPSIYQYRVADHLYKNDYFLHVSPLWQSSSSVSVNEMGQMILPHNQVDKWMPLNLQPDDNVRILKFIEEKVTHM